MTEQTTEVTLRDALPPQWTRRITADVLTCPTDAHCGVVIIALCNAATTLIDLMDGEDDQQEQVYAATVRMIDIVWFG